MDEDERHRLEDMERKINEMYRALMEPGADGSDPFFYRASAVVTTFERGKWGGKLLVRGIAIAVSVLAALAFFTKGGGAR